MKPGDHVDLLVHLNKSASQGIPETVTKTFLQDVKVFAVNSAIKEKSDGSAMSAKTVSLLLTPPQVETVSFAGQLGRITLSMRSPKDTGTFETDGGGINDVLARLVSRTTQGAPAPADAARQKKVETEKEAEKAKSVKDAWTDMFLRFQLATKTQTSNPEPDRWVMVLQKGDVGPEGDQTYEIFEGGGGRTTPRVIKVNAEEFTESADKLDEDIELNKDAFFREKEEEGDENAFTGADGKDNGEKDDD